MRGFSTGKLGAPMLNPSYLNLSRDKAPGWGMNGPGVSAEWTQWRERGTRCGQRRRNEGDDLPGPRSAARGPYRLWVRYADWATKAENFTLTIAQITSRSFAGSSASGTSSIRMMKPSCTGAGRSRGTGDPTVRRRTGPSFDQRRESCHRTASRRLLRAHERSRVTVRPREKPDFAAQRYLRTWSSHANRSLRFPRRALPFSRSGCGQNRRRGRRLRLATGTSRKSSGRCWKTRRRAAPLSVQRRTDRGVCQKVQRRARRAVVSIETGRAGCLHQQRSRVPERGSISVTCARRKFRLRFSSTTARHDERRGRRPFGNC